MYWKSDSERGKHDPLKSRINFAVTGRNNLYQNSKDKRAIFLPGISGRVKFLPLAWAGMPKTSFRKNSDSPPMLISFITKVSGFIYSMNPCVLAS
jgi:hypothetical protein